MVPERRRGRQNVRRRGPIKALESVIYSPTCPRGGRFYVRFHRSAVKSRLKSLRNGAGPLDVPP